MQKKYENRMLSSGEEKGQGPSALRCLRECVVPGIGFYQPGDVVTDAEKVEYLKSNPNFEETKEVG